MSGSPDLVFPRLKKVILVHGCFWHMHTCPRGCRIPATRRSYWLAKLERNHIRDLATRRALRRLGYRTLTIWECQTKSPTPLTRHLSTFLSTP